MVSLTFVGIVLRRVFYHLLHEKIAFSNVVFSDCQPCLFSGNLKPLFKRNEDIFQNAPGSFSEFWQLGPAVSVLGPPFW